MAFETITLAREESYALITLNRPPANVLSSRTRFSSSYVRSMLVSLSVTVRRLPTLS